jgi:hypothetical protein
MRVQSYQTAGLMNHNFRHKSARSDSIFGLSHRKFMSRNPNILHTFQMSETGKDTPRKVWRIEKPGNLRKLKQCDDLLPPPSTGEVSVRVESVGLNFADVFTVLGMYDAAPRDKPVIPGLEFCGIVEAIGDRKGVPKAKVTRNQDGSRWPATLCDHDSFPSAPYLLLVSVDPRAISDPVAIHLSCLTMFLNEGHY